MEWQALSETEQTLIRLLLSNLVLVNIVVQTHLSVNVHTFSESNSEIVKFFSHSQLGSVLKGKP